MFVVTVVTVTFAVTETEMSILSFCNLRLYKNYKDLQHCVIITFFHIKSLLLLFSFPIQNLQRILNKTYNLNLS